MTFKYNTPQTRSAPALKNKKSNQSAQISKSKTVRSFQWRGCGIASRASSFYFPTHSIDTAGRFSFHPRRSRMTTELKNHKKGYFNVENNLLDKWLRIIGPGAFITYQELNRFCRGGEHIPFPNVTMKDWATWIGISRQSFILHIKTLETHGLIVVLPGNNPSGFIKEANRYEILELPEPTADDLETVSNFPKNCHFGDPLRGEPLFRSDLPDVKKVDIDQCKKSRHADVKKVDNTITTDKNNTTKDFLDVNNKFDPEDLPMHLGKNNALNDAWVAFVQDRKERKKPLTKGAYTLLLNKMKRHTPEEIVAALERAVERRWLSIFYDDNQSTAKPGTTSSSSKETLQSATRRFPADNSDYGNSMGIRDVDFK
jgi:hypothetical protein